MSFERPRNTRIISSVMPTADRRSKTSRPIAFPRRASISENRMWPPSSGRSGSRFSSASERLIRPRI
jgi:hypothetical protein